MKSGTDPRSWLDRLLGLCLTLLVAVMALYAAVRLLQAILVPLLVIAGGVLVVSAVVCWWRSRRRGW